MLRGIVAARVIRCQQQRARDPITAHTHDKSFGTKARGFGCDFLGSHHHVHCRSGITIEPFVHFDGGRDSGPVEIVCHETRQQRRGRLPKIWKLDVRHQDIGANIFLIEILIEQPVHRRPRKLQASKRVDKDSLLIAANRLKQIIRDQKFVFVIPGPLRVAIVRDLIQERLEMIGSRIIPHVAQPRPAVTDARRHLNI